MATFFDSENRLWRLKISVGALKRVRDKFDGLNLVDDSVFMTLAADPILLVDVVWELLDKSDHPEITAEQFGESLGGDAIEKAVDAFAEAIFDFFPKGRRELQRAMYQRIRTAQSELMNQAAETIKTAKLDAETHALLKS